MQVDRRTTAEVEKTRCYQNNKPYRTGEQQATAQRMAHRVNGAVVSPTPRSWHDRCPCGKGTKEQCVTGSAKARNERVKRLR